MANEIVLHVRYIVDLSMFAIRTTTDSTVAEFKLLVAAEFDLPVDRQRLVHNYGELLDDQTIESYGLQEGHVVYLFRRSVTDTASASTPLVGNGTPDISGSSDRSVSGVLINVQYSSETRFAIQARLESTVGEFKGLISQLQSIPVNEQRLIYSGQFLQDEETIGSYGVQEGHVIHLVRRLVPATSCTSASVAAPPPLGGNNTDAFLIGAGFDQSHGFEGEASSLFGDGLPGFDLLQHISGNPNTISEVMNIPGQNLMDEPHIVRIIMMSNTWIRESIDRNPEFVYVLSNPGALRRRLEAVRSLENIRETVQIRITRNIESFPEGSEGSSMLRQRYENVPEPLSPLLNAPHNPWGPNAGPSGFAGAYVPGFSGSGIPGPSGFAGAYVPGNAGLGIPGPSGLDAQSSSFIDPATRIQPLQHPATFQVIDEVIHNDPQSSSQVDFNPQVLEELQIPEMSTSQLASSGMLQQLRASPAYPYYSTSRGTDQTARGAAGMFDGQTAGRAVPFEENLIDQQLSQLHQMGFTDNYANLRALIATSGNIRAAVALLLQNLGR